MLIYYVLYVHNLITLSSARNKHVNITLDTFAFAQKPHSHACYFNDTDKLLNYALYNFHIQRCVYAINRTRARAQRRSVAHKFDYNLRYWQ